MLICEFTSNARDLGHKITKMHQFVAYSTHPGTLKKSMTEKPAFQVTLSVFHFPFLKPARSFRLALVG